MSAAWILGAPRLLETTGSLLSIPGLSGVPWHLGFSFLWGLQNGELGSCGPSPVRARGSCRGL